MLASLAFISIPPNWINTAKLSSSISGTATGYKDLRTPSRRGWLIYPACDTYCIKRKGSYILNCTIFIGQSNAGSYLESRHIASITWITYCLCFDFHWRKHWSAKTCIEWWNKIVSLLWDETKRAHFISRQRYVVTQTLSQSVNCVLVFADVCCRSAWFEMILALVLKEVNGVSSLLMGLVSGSFYKVLLSCQCQTFLTQEWLQLQSSCFVSYQSLWNERDRMR